MAKWKLMVNYIVLLKVKLMIRMLMKNLMELNIIMWVVQELSVSMKYQEQI